MAQASHLTNLLLEYDESVDAAYLRASDAPWHHQERLDDARGINYSADGSVIGIEILSPRRKGVRLEGLPFRDDVARVMRAVGFRIIMSEAKVSDRHRTVYERLVQAARAGQFVHYGELAKMLGIDTNNPHFAAQVGAVLGRISEDEIAAGRPMLSSIVVSKDTKLPGRGFFNLGEQLRQTRPGEDEIAFAVRQIRQTHAYWKNTPAPTEAA